MFNFSRRINGVTYYAGFALSLLPLVAASILANSLQTNTVVDTIIGLTILSVALFLFVYWLCLMRQRANDIGWHPLLLTLVAFTTPLFLVLGFIPGRATRNDYGVPPRKGISLRP